MCLFVNEALSDLQDATRDGDTLRAAQVMISLIANIQLIAFLAYEAVLLLAIVWGGRRRFWPHGMATRETLLLPVTGVELSIVDHRSI